MKNYCLSILASLSFVNAITESEFDSLHLTLRKELTNFYVNDAGSAVDISSGLGPLSVFRDCLNGCDGCINYDELVSQEPRAADVHSYIEYLDDIFDATEVDISRADFLVLAANVEVNLFSVNPEQPPTKKLKDLVREFKYGRPEKTCYAAGCSETITGDGGFYDCSESGTATDPKKGYGHVKSVAKDLKLTTKEFVSLMGSQLLSPSKLEPAFTNVFDNRYYTTIYGSNLNRIQWYQDSSDYSWKFGNFLNVQNVDLSLLNNIGVDSDGKAKCKSTDMSASQDNKFFSKCRTLSKTMLTNVKNYSSNHVLWMNDFSKAWKKMTEKQFKNLKKVSNVRKYDIIYPEVIRDPEEEKKAEQKTNLISMLLNASK